LRRLCRGRCAGSPRLRMGRANDQEARRHDGPKRTGATQKEVSMHNVTRRPCWGVYLPET